MIHRFARVAIAVLVMGIGFVGIVSSPAYANATIVVNSTADSQADDGECTLREAIIAANTNTVSGATVGECTAGDAGGGDTITFNISGTPDFTNNGQDGYTIKPQSALPDITETVTINGYSQPGAQPNTAGAPNPLNGTLLIELDGSEAGGAGAFVFGPGSDNSVVRGLVVGGFADADALKIGADDIEIQGNYIGTDYTGMSANPNMVGVNGTSPTPHGEDALVGGLDPEDRNLISGNTAGSVATGSYPATGWTLQGNYVGVARDGLTALANSTVGGSGSFSIDNAEGVTIGGPELTAINVIGASLGHGLAPLNADDLLIENNYIGLGYDGTTLLGNMSTGQGSGIAISESDNAIIKNNVVAGWTTGGISINSDNNSVIVESNTIHDNASNITVQGLTSDITIINNFLYASNGPSNLSIGGVSFIGWLTDSITAQGNRIGYLPSGDPAPADNTMGILVYGDPTNVLIGGTGAGQGNEIHGATGAGINVMTFTADAIGTSLTPQKVSILGNAVTNTSSGVFDAPGLGIDLSEGIDTDPSPDGSPDIVIDEGVTVNDISDTDTGANGYINFPVLNSVEQNGSTATINFNLDAADSPVDQYRVEFFANDEADPTGYGEGQTLLGAVTVGNGEGQQASITLPDNLNLTGKSISATTTAVDSTTDSGFGGTSEFSATITVANAVDDSDTALANSGMATVWTTIAALFVAGGGSAALIVSRNRIITLR